MYSTQPLPRLAVPKSMSSSGEALSALACLDILQGAAHMAMQQGPTIQQLIGSCVAEGQRDAVEHVALRLQSLAGCLSEIVELSSALLRDPPTPSDHACPRRQPLTYAEEVTAAGDASGLMVPVKPVVEAPHPPAKPLPVPATSASPPRRPACGRVASSLVKSSSDLLDLIVGYLSGSGREQRRDLGRVAATCRLWRAVAVRDRHWRQAARDLLIEARAPAREARGRGGGLACRQELMDYGRCLVQRRVWGVAEWWEGLRLGLEVYDANDGQRILFVTGAMAVSGYNEENDGVRLDMQPGPDLRFVPGPLFSIPGKDKGRLEVKTFEEYFNPGGEGVHHGPARARITVTETRSGRSALLWELKEFAAYADGTEWYFSSRDGPQHTAAVPVGMEPFVFRLHLTLRLCQDERFWAEYEEKERMGYEPSGYYQVVQGERGQEWGDDFTMRVYGDRRDDLGYYIRSLLL